MSCEKCFKIIHNIHPQHQQFIYAAPNGVRNPTPMQLSPYGAVPSAGGGGYNTYAPAAGLQTSAAALPQQNIYSQQPFFAQGGISYARGPGGQYQPMIYQPQQLVPPQQHQSFLAKREKKILQFINPNTGLSIFNNIFNKPPPSVGAPKEMNAGPGASAVATKKNTGLSIFNNIFNKPPPSVGAPKEMNAGPGASAVATKKNTGLSIFNNIFNKPPPSVGAPKEMNAGPGASAVATKKNTEEQISKYWLSLLVEANEIEETKKKFRAILNKLTPQNFDVLVKQFQELPIVTKETMESCMELVFEKAVGEPAFSKAYALMCHHLSQREVVEGGEKVKFRTILIRRVQKEFDKDYMKDVDLALKKKSVNMELSQDERAKAKHEFEMQERKARQISLGKIRFIGELYNLQLLTVNNMHDCVSKLIKKTDEESLDCLCRVITTVGSQFEKETNLIMLEGKILEDLRGKIFSMENQRKKYPSVRPIKDYFDKMLDIINKKATSSRVRFLMQDVIDLRKA